MARRPNLPAATLVLFVRHGTTATTGKVLPGRAPGLLLSPAGEAEAAVTAERVAAMSRANGSLPFAAVYSSPMERARQTATPLARALGLRVRTEAGLNECDFGDWTGRRLRELRKLPEWEAVQRHPSGFRFPGGESFTEMQARITGAVARLCERHPGSTVVVVSHADPIKAAVAAAAGTSLDLFQRIVISPCSVSVVSYAAAGPTVLAVNSTSDLATLAPS